MLRGDVPTIAAPLCGNATALRLTMRSVAFLPCGVLHFIQHSNPTPRVVYSSAHELNAFSSLSLVIDPHQIVTGLARVLIATITLAS